MLRALTLGRASVLAPTAFIKYFNIKRLLSQPASKPEQAPEYPSSNWKPIPDHIPEPCILSYADYEDTWKQFKIDYKRNYATEEEERMRFNIFTEGLKYIEKHNLKYHKGLTSFYLGINHFADLTDEELKVCCGGCLGISNENLPKTKNDPDQ